MLHMGSPAGPIYASTLHRRDRGWRPRRRRRALLRARSLVWTGAAAVIAAMLVAHFG